MIVLGVGIAKATADLGGGSLDKEVSRLRAEGRLEAEKKTLEKLNWTPETLKAAREFEDVCFRTAVT
jgi:hypothetical protein